VSLVYKLPLVMDLMDLCTSSMAEVVVVVENTVQVQESVHMLVWAECM
jgi:hypothetical protein